MEMPSLVRSTALSEALLQLPSLLNQDVVKVHNACAVVLGKPGERCLIFPALSHAEACRDMLLDLIPDAASHVRVDAAAFCLHESRSRKVQCCKKARARRFYLVFFPERFSANAMTFWTLTGTGISSRLAENMREHLESVRPAPVIEQDENSGLNRELAFTTTHAYANILARRVMSNLLKCASISSERSSRVSPSDVFLYPTGMAAIYGCNKLLQNWRLDQSIVFGFPYELTLKLLQKYGNVCRIYICGADEELDELEIYLATERRLGRKVQSVCCECASNPPLRTVVLDRVRRLANEYGFVVVVNTTIKSVANVGFVDAADIVVTSLTKSFCGHADVMAGSIFLNPMSPYYIELKQSLDFAYVNELFGEDAIVLTQEPKIPPAGSYDERER